MPVKEALEYTAGHGRYSPVRPTAEDTNYKAGKSRSCHVTTAVVLLLAACITLAILVIIFATWERPIGKCVSYPSKNTSAANKVCLSAACVEVAARYLSNMDLQADPCDDFFNYTCQGFVTKNPLHGYDLIKDLGINNIPIATDLKLIKTLERPGKELYGEPSEAVGKVKDLYHTCRTVSSNQKNGPAILQQYIDSFGGWSLSGGDTDKDVDIELVAALVHRSNSEGLFKPWIVANPANQNRYQIRFQPSAVTYPSASLYKPKTRSRSRLASYISSVISLLGGDTNSTAKRKRIEDIINIEKAIIEMTPPPSYQKYSVNNNNKKTIKEIQELIGSKMIRYISNLLGKPITEEHILLVESSQYMAEMKQIFNNYTKQAVADYLVWTWVHGHLMYLSQPCVRLYEAFTRRSVKYEADTCLQLTKKYFNQVLGALYIHHHYNRQYDAVVSDMMQRLKQAFSANIKEADWMENVSKIKTKEKLDSMQQVVGYLDIHTNATKLDANYANSGEVIKGDFLGSIDNLQKGLFSHQLSLLGERQTIMKAVSELQAPYDAGASYATYQNTILVWAGIMQYAFYDPRSPAAATFGSLGFVVGHEVMHAFDNNGKDFDKDGNYMQWWDNNTLSMFQERTHCFVDQYDQYTVTANSNINGSRTLGENIADNGAVKIAYYAHQSWLKSHRGFELEANLPGVNLTAEQLFFVGMATPLCTVEADILSIYNIKNSPHSQARYRIIGALSNFEKFAEAFKCPVGSRMNPRDRCSLW